MKIFYYGNFIDIKIGQEVTVAKTGSGRTIFGEPAILKKTTKRHLVFKTKSGKTVRCPIDNLSHTIGKANKAGYFVMTQKFEDVKNIIRHPVMF